jgi:hypothetical protein
MRVSVQCESRILPYCFPHYPCPGSGVAVQTLLDRDDDADYDLGRGISHQHARHRLRDGGDGSALEQRVMVMQSVCKWQQGPRKHAQTLAASVRRIFDIRVVSS